MLRYLAGCSNFFASIMGEESFDMYHFISKHCLYPLYETLSGRRFLQKLAFLEQSQWWDRKKLQEYQWEKTKAIMNYAFENNRYYKKQFRLYDTHPDRIKDSKDFAKIPILTKDDILKNLPAFVSKGYKPKHLHKSATGGSTGRNLTFYIDRNSLDFTTARVLRAMKWFNVDFGDRRIKVWGSPIKETLKQRTIMALRNMLLREQFVSSYQMNEKRVRNIVRRIQRVEPKALIGYVSALNILAQFIDENQIRDVRVDAIVPAAETIFEHQIALFERAFHGKVFNRYGSREFNAIAQDCSFHSGMHINSESLYVEVIKDGRPARAGEMGEIVITDLENFGMPFIRYRIEDLGVLRSGICGCGRGLPLLDRVEGRVYDLISCPNGTIQTGTFFSNLTRSVQGISQFQVIQESKEKIRLKLAIDGRFRQDSTTILKKAIRKYCGETMEVDFELVETIEPLKSGKHRYVVSLANSTPWGLN